jgi:hypothetical protein
VAWLTRDAEVLAAVVSRPARRRGEPEQPSGVVVLRHPLTLPSRRACALDVAWCRPEPGGAGGAGGAVVLVRRTRTVTGRLARWPAWPAPVVLVAPAGAFERWRLRAGDRLEITAG